MARTNVWSDTQPADANAANTAAAVDRVQRLDIRECFQQLIGNALGDALQDPIVGSTQTIEAMDARIIALEDAVNPGVATSYSILGAEFVQDGVSANDIIPTMQSPVAIVTNAKILKCGVHLPIGAVFTSVEWYVHSTGVGASTVTSVVHKKTLTAVSTSNTISASFTNNPGSDPWVGGNMKTFTTSPGDTIAAGVAYGLFILLTPIGGDTLYFHGCKINYTTPTS